jgi:hypothetical protein
MFNLSLGEILGAPLSAAITERGGTTGIAIAHAGFDEVVDIFKLATADPVLSSVRWYGTDGTALSEPLRTNAVAAAFAKKVSFWTPTPGVDDGDRARWEPIATRIAAKAGAQPDAFALAVYDAVWLTAQSYLAAGGTGHAAALKSAFVTAADGFHGTSGWTKLNAAGDRKFLSAFHELRNVAAPQVPVPLQHVAVAAYSDEAHVEENRRLYRIKFDLADQILGGSYGYVRPAGGFCVWLDVSERGGDEAVAVKLYRDAGVRVIPGSYLSRPQNDGFNPGAGYIRLALVSDSESTAEALHRLIEILD